MDTDHYAHHIQNRPLQQGLGMRLRVLNLNKPWRAFHPCKGLPWVPHFRKMKLQLRLMLAKKRLQHHLSELSMFESENGVPKSLVLFSFISTVFHNSHEGSATSAVAYSFFFFFEPGRCSTAWTTELGCPPTTHGRTECLNKKRFPPPPPPEQHQTSVQVAMWHWIVTLPCGCYKSFESLLLNLLAPDALIINSLLCVWIF